MTLAQEKGTSSWLTTLPINEFGFALYKGAFQDALALRYGWLPLHAPTTKCGVLITTGKQVFCVNGLSKHITLSKPFQSRFRRLSQFISSKM